MPKKNKMKKPRSLAAIAAQFRNSAGAMKVQKKKRQQDKGAFYRTLDNEFGDLDDLFEEEHPFYFEPDEEDLNED